MRMLITLVCAILLTLLLCGCTLRPFGISPVMIVIGKVYVGQTNITTAASRQTAEPEIEPKKEWRPLTDG
jgi:hypothetical protein